MSLEWHDFYSIEKNNKLNTEDIYYNFFQAVDASLEDGKPKHFVRYNADPEFVQSVEFTRKPKDLSINKTKKLLIQGLQRARKRHNKLRLLYSGGTDSWNILKFCIENDIYVDELICHLHSMEESPENMQTRTNIEFLPGLKWARQFEGKQVGKIITPKFSIETLKRFVADKERFKYTPGPFNSFRVAMMMSYWQTLDTTDTVTITGMEKPTIVVKNNQPFWTLLDDPVGEFMGIQNHLPIYLDKHNPELQVQMTYAMLEVTPSEMLQGDFKFLNFPAFEDVKIKADILGVWGLKTPKNWLNNHKLKSESNSKSIKTTYLLRELKHLGLSHLIDEYSSDLEKIYNDYKHIPHTVTHENGWLETDKRFSQTIKIGSEAFGRQDNY